MKVYEAINELLKFKGFCSYAEIAQVSGLKKIEVLKILNNNRVLLKLHSKHSDRIIGLTNNNIICTITEDGKRYWLEGENYGCIEVIRFKGNNLLQKKLEKQYICGGMGDNYPIMCIQNTKENLDEVRAAGLLTYEELNKEHTVLKYWKE